MRADPVTAPSKATRALLGRPTRLPLAGFLRERRRRPIALGVLLVGAIASGLLLAEPFASSAPIPTLPISVGVRVVGNHLVDSSGQTVVLRGVDRSGMEYACVQGWGLADGPMDQSSVDEMRAWGVNAVRLPLNEDCWLGINGVKAAYSGAPYRRAVLAYVAELHRDGIVAILDLHWSAPGTELATSQQDMADADHSPAFWSSVASTFLANPGVIFDLFNEPHGISWQCWSEGCDSPGYETAGMQSLLDAVRATGATQPVMVAPLGWAGAPGGPAEDGPDPAQGWLKWHPVDPANQEILSIHLYNFSGCNSASCWNSTIAPVASTTPVVIGEFGEDDCGTVFDDSLMDWSDAQGISYLAWAWNASSNHCGSAGPSVITSSSGDPTTSGAAIEQHYQAVASLSALPASGTPAAGSPGARPNSPTGPSTTSTTTASTTTASTTTTTTTTTVPATVPPTTVLVPTSPVPTTLPVSGTGGLAFSLETTNSWPNGAQEELVVTNTSSETFNGPIQVPFAQPVDVTDSWFGTLTGGGSEWTAELPVWSPSIPAGESAVFGFIVKGLPPTLGGS